MLIGGIVMYYLGGNTQRSLLFPIGGIVASVLIAEVGCWMWRIQSTPLIVDAKTGKVRCGKKVICEAGTVKAFRLACSQLDAEENNCTFDFTIDSGDVVEIPSPWFAAMSATTSSEMARTIAGLLKVDVQNKEPFSWIMSRLR